MSRIHKTGYISSIIWIYMHILNISNWFCYLVILGKLHIGRKDVTLTVYDCSSKEEHLGIRSFAYQDTDVCILCYSVADRNSFENVKSKWSEEIRSLMGHKLPIVLVATQTDLRNSISLDDDIPISMDEGQKLANEIQANIFLECTSKCPDLVLKVFESAAKEGLKYRRKSNSFLKKLFSR